MFQSARSYLPSHTLREKTLPSRLSTSPPIIPKLRRFLENFYWTESKYCEPFSFLMCNPIVLVDDMAASFRANQVKYHSGKLDSRNMSSSLSPLQKDI